MRPLPDSVPAVAPELQARVDACLGGLPAGAPVGVAVSGGPDSLTLALACAHAGRAQRRPIHLLHVHHGLLAEADAWALGVRALARRLGVEAAVARVRVDVQGQGVEGAARAARYRALAGLARERGIAHVLLGHHADDQAETVLIRLLRGTGPAGLAGMRPASVRDGVHYLRCWLDVPRDTIVAHAAELAARLDVPLANDPTNLDARHARGLLRSRVLPAIAQHWPGYRATLARHARLAHEAGEILAEVAAQDLASVERHQPEYGTVLDLNAWRRLSPARARQALRAWLAARGLPMPAENRLADFVRQLRDARTDGQVRLAHAGRILGVYRQRLALLPASASGAAAQGGAGAGEQGSGWEHHWRGEPALAVPELGGRLCFTPAEQGCDEAWLRAEPLRIGLRRGGERLRLHARGPERSLKNLFQERGIPAWARARLPLVWRGGILIYVAGLGLAAGVPRAQPGWRLHWEADPPHAGDAHGSGGPE